MDDAKCAACKLKCRMGAPQGNLIWPLLLDNVDTGMRIAWEEPFGPVIPVVSQPSIYLSDPHQFDRLYHWSYLSQQKCVHEVACDHTLPLLQVRVKTIEEAIDHTNANNLALQVHIPTSEAFQTC
jgi:Aldehyde dehydrogenase family